MLDDQAYEIRFLRLERRLRLTNFGFVVVACLLLVSVAWHLIPASKGTVFAREVVIEDEEGRARMTLSTNPDGRPLLTLRDASGQPGITLGYNLADKPGLNVGLFGPRTWIGFADAGYPTVELQDDTGAALVELALGPDGRPGVRVAAANTDAPATREF